MNTSGAVLFALFGFGVFASTEVYSEGDSPGDGDEKAVLEEVVVTGSRVRRSNLDAPSPVLVLDAGLLADSGITTLGEFSRYLPQNSDTLSDSNSGNRSSRGAAAFNLRGIGVDGTLTLVNGRRVAPFGSSGDAEPFVDINAIPIAAIERIEVLKDGASAIYGSEAVAGVVNIITRRSMDGLVAEAGWLTTSEGDGEEWDLNLTGGRSGGDTNFVGTLSWFDRDLIWSRDRDWASDVDLRPRGGPNQRSTASSPATIDLLQSRRRIADPACPEQTVVNSRVTVVQGGIPREFCLFNFAWFTTLQQPSERLGGMAALQHAFSDRLGGHAELIYNRTVTDSVLAPTPLFFYFVPDYHPQNPFGENLLLRYRALDTGNRGVETTSTTWRFVAGLEGEFGAWEWDAGLSRSEAESEDSRIKGVLSEAFQDALLGFGGPSGDRFYNPFGLDPQNPQEVLDAFLISGTRIVQTNTETAADFQVNGLFGTLPGGPVGAALGGQWREIDMKQVADPEELSGVIEGGGGILPLIEDRRVWSVFGELVLPVHRTLEAQLALRYDEYNDFGSTTNPKIGLGWRPRPDLLLRATWGTSFRPPTFRELFDPRLEFETFTFDDPLRCPVTGEFFDCAGREVLGTNAGNPELQPDEGETRLLGFAWEPQSVDGLALALDLWEIENDGRVVLTGDAFSPIYQFFIGNLPPDENPYVIRAPRSDEDIALGIPGPIIGIASTYINAGKVTTRGVDVDASYRWSSSRTGDYSVRLNYAYLEEYSIGIDSGGASFREDWAGRYGEVSALPRHRANLSLDFARNAHGVNALLLYTSRYDSPVTLWADGANTGEVFVVDDYFQLNLQYTHTFTHVRDAMLRVGCQNCLDADPPVYNYAVVSEPFHEGRGVLWYVRWVQPF